jgi:uncharacterized protein (TIGR00297 family)
MTLLSHPPFWFAACLALLFAGGAYAARLLSASGAVSTFLVGLVIYGLGGGEWAVPLLAFFLSSSLLSKLFRRRKAASESAEAKGSVRDAGQVWANGGVPVLMVLCFWFFRLRLPTYQLQFFPLLYLAALAAMNADTWATEIGKLAPRPPRLLSNFKPTEPGTSGAVSITGLLAALAGAAFVPLCTLLVWKLDSVAFFVVMWSGFLGSFADSILGASIQAVYREPETGRLTERTHINGTPNQKVRGLRWMTNDVVNFVAAVIAALCAWLILRYAGYPFL